jgi:RNA polymerase sigma factor (TIGR02999 family)
VDESGSEPSETIEVTLESAEVADRGGDFAVGPAIRVDATDLTVVLNAARAGDPESAAISWELVIVDLRRIASGVTRQFQTSRRRMAGLAGGVPNGVASPTTVVHEAFLKVFDRSTPIEWSSRRHFFGTMARAMTTYLLDRCRHDRTLKRGRDVRLVPLEFVQDELADIDDGIDLARRGVFEAIERLERVRPIAAEVVRLRFIVGLSQDQTSEITGIARRTVSKHWNFARAFIRREIARADPAD